MIPFEEFAEMRRVATELQVYRLAIKIAPPLVIVRDTECAYMPGRVFDVSEAFAGLLKYSRADLQDSVLMDYVNEAHRQRTLDMFTYLSQSQSRLREPFENVYDASDGTEVPLRWTRQGDEVMPGYRIAYCELRQEAA